MQAKPIFRRAAGHEVVDLRHAILRAGLPRATAVFSGDEAASTRHYVAEVEGRIVACLSFMESSLDGRPVWQLRGMAVAGDWQRSGLGRALLAFAEASIAEESPVRQLWCNARKLAVGFYERQGWRVVSDEFVIETAGPHFRMAKELPPATGSASV